MISARFQNLRTLIAACLLIGWTPSASAQTVSANRLSTHPTLVVLIGGMDSDPTPEQIAGTAKRDSGNSGLFRLQGDLQRPGIVTEYFNWNGTRAGKLNSRTASEISQIAQVIREHVRHHLRSRVILVGNSWGGHTTWEVCQALVDSPTPVAIDYVVFLDSSSTGRANTTRPRQLPININRATNIYTRNLFGWRKWPKEDRIENIDLGDAQQGFLLKGGPAYDSSFDFSAHVAAEWDERIHAAIKRKILDLVPENPHREPIPKSANGVFTVEVPQIEANANKSP